ncbi:MAG: hypothetical protein HDS86_00885 [Bacteroidales bacterium]|nr:hypothetical protein [Bacteroidales bacterium]
MKNLLLHIRYLLRSHDCVTIPGIGSFIAATLPALVDESRALFMPPTRYISFNSEITHNDGLIAASVARRDAVSFETATAKVEKAVEQMRRDLSQFRFIDFHGIGTLSLDDQGLLQFIPEASAEFINPYSILQPVAMHIEAAEEPVAPKRRPRIIRIGAGAMRVAASVAITVSLGALLFFPLRDSSTLPFIKAAIWPSAMSNVQATPAFVEKPQPHVELIFAEAPAHGHEILQTSGITAQDEETPAPVFGVVVGVFSDADKAEIFIGNTPGLVTYPAKNGRQFRVCAATASTMEECAAMASKYRADGTWPEAWPARLR